MWNEYETPRASPFDTLAVSNQYPALRGTTPIPLALNDIVGFVMLIRELIARVKLSLNEVVKAQKNPGLPTQTVRNFQKGDIPMNESRSSSNCIISK